MQITKVQGESVSLYCRYDANPSPGTVVTWYHDGAVVRFLDGGPYARGAPDASVLRVDDASTGAHDHDPLALAHFDISTTGPPGRGGRARIQHLLCAGPEDIRSVGTIPRS